MQDTPARADLVIHPRWVIPVEPEGRVLENTSVVVDRGRITALLGRDQARRVEAQDSLELPGQVLLPGLVNAHGHGAMSLLRGYADDLPLMPWLEEHIWPAETRHVDAAFVRDGVQLAIAGMLRSGTTTCSDMYFFPEQAAREYRAAGMRAQIAFPIFDVASAWGSGPDDYLAKGLALIDEYRHADLQAVVFGPHAPYTVSEATLARIATLAAELDVGVHIHLHETAAEVLQAVERCGERPLDTLNRIGLLGPRTQCVHMTDLGNQDIALLAETGSHVVHCPHSNMKLASGTCPVAQLLAAGVNVALGSDGAASNNSLNLFLEMRSAALLGKLAARDPAALPAATVLAMATLGGARALGMDDQIGSLVPGKQADMIAVDLSGSATQPVYNPISQLVYACTGSEVTHSWVAGRALLEDNRLTSIDESAVRRHAAQWCNTISARGQQPT
ncbi:MAG: TRZ/ATZ family hydrolase [Chromatocurvus sp.]